MITIWNKLNSLLSGLSGVLLGLAMLVTGIEVIARYVFNSPIVGVVDLVTIMIPIFVFLPMADTEIHNKHIRVELLSTLIGNPRLNLFFDFVTYVCGIILLGLMAWVMWEFAFLSWRAGEYLPGLRRLPVWPSKFAMAIGISLLAFQILVNGIKTITKFVSR